MQKYNVMFAIEDLEVGGAERVVIQLARGLDKSRFRVFVACLRKPGALAAELEGSIEDLFVLDKLAKIDVLMLRRFVDLLKDKHIDLLNTHLVTANTWGRIAGKKAGTPVVVATEHSTDIWKGWLQRGIDRWLAGRCDRVITVSRSVRDFYRDVVGIPEEKLVIILNGIDRTPWKKTGTREKTRRELGIAEDASVIGTVGRLIEDKAQVDLLRAALLIGNVEVVIAGQGPLLEKLKKQARQIGVADSVHFLGQRGDVREILEAIDVFALPSRREGLSITLLEAMAMGIPVVASRVGGNTEVIENGETGLLVPFGDEPALASAIERILNDKWLARNLGNSAKKLLTEKFTERNMIRQTEDLFLSLLLEKNVTTR